VAGQPDIIGAERGLGCTHLNLGGWSEIPDPHSQGQEEGTSSEDECGDELENMYAPGFASPEQSRIQFLEQGVNKTMPALFRMTETCQRADLTPSSTTDKPSLQSMDPGRHG
jgi:hypothetical protein